MYTIDEIITSISEKPLRTGLSEVASDTVDPRQHLRHIFGATRIRVNRSLAPVSMLQILQPDIEMWRYLRLCSLSEEEFHDLARRQPLVVVRGKSIQGYPLLQGNHRALYALIHGIEKLPSKIYFLTDEFAALQFSASAQQQYQNLDVKFGRHDAVCLREAYKRILEQVVHLRRRERAYLQPPDALFSTRAARYRQLREENEWVSSKIPCISLEGYIQTLRKMFKIPRSALRLSEESVFFRGLVMTQHAIEREKMERIVANKRLYEAPVLLVRTPTLDYVAAGHTRLRARLDRGEKRIDAILIHIRQDALHRFLDGQARTTDYLSGNEGIRRMELI